MQVIVMDTQERAEAHARQTLDVEDLGYVSRNRDSQQWGTEDRHIRIAAWVSYMSGGQIATTVEYVTSGENGEHGFLFIYSEGYEGLNNVQVRDAFAKVGKL